MKTIFAGFTVFLIFLFSGCSAPGYDTPEVFSLRAEKYGSNVKLYCSYSGDTEFIDIYCRGPAQGQLEYYISEKVTYYPASFTLDGTNLASFGDNSSPPATYSFAVKARNSFGSSAMFSSTTIDLPFPKPPDTPSAVATLNIDADGYVWDHPKAYVKFNPAESGMVYSITIDGTPAYNDYPPVVIGGSPCLAILKSYIPPGGSYNIVISVKNKYTGNTALSPAIILTTPPPKPWIQLNPPTLSSGYVRLWHAPIDYSPQFKVFCDSASGFAPSAANQISDLYQTNGYSISIPRNLFPTTSGTYYVKVQATGVYDTGDYSNEITLTLP
jgi:hypothetical protein